MKVTETENTYKITFGHNDFQRGIAYRIMDYIKSLPRHQWDYNGNSKSWEIPKHPHHLKKMGDSVQDLLPDGIHLFVDPSQFDVDEWLDETFGMAPRPKGTKGLTL